MNSSLPTTKILGTNITNASKNEILDFIGKNISERGVKIPIVTPNPEILMYAASHKQFQEVLNRAKISLADGVGVVISGKILKKGIKERITGVDFMLDLCSLAAERGFTVGFLGGREGVAEKTAKCLVKKYPDLRVIYTDHEDRLARIEIPRKSDTNQRESNSHIDILFVAFGFPKQEIWIDENLDKIPVTVAMGVGGAFDYISGNVKRAPKFVRNVGMEWAFRLAAQPWRIKRQMALPKFAIEVLKERFKK